MKSLFLKAQGLLCLFVYTFLLLFKGGGAALINNGVAECSADTAFSRAADNLRISSRLWELLFNKEENFTPELTSGQMLIPGGCVFGLVIDEVGATVCGGSSGRLREGDRILKVNGLAVADGKDVERAAKASEGKPLLLEIMRGEERLRMTVSPRLCDGEYKLGVTLRSQTAGIGTVTFIEPESLCFGGLGHGVSDGEGNQVTVERGAATGVVLGGCKRGERGHAGELTGVLNKTRLGSIFTNTPCGVFGRLDTLPSGLDKPLPVAERTEVRVGEAEIISTVKGEKRQSYKIEITEIDLSATGSKSFKIKVTDPTLIALTGGIVRGMSGSPIIQDGKLIGAVTHVLVGDPTEGYGIFIENMLTAAQIPMAKAS